MVAAATRTAEAAVTVEQEAAQGGAEEPARAEAVTKRSLRSNELLQTAILRTATKLRRRKRRRRERAPLLRLDTTHQTAIEIEER